MSALGHDPHYRRIEHALRQRIRSMRPGERLPSDAELCAEFGVSRMTARNAMQVLADEGLIRRVPGRGSFVATPPVHRRANRLMTFSQEMQRAGRVPSSHVLERRVRPASDAEADQLDVDAGASIVEIRRLRLADGEPHALETAVLIGETSDAVMDADLAGGSLHEALTRAGFRLIHGSGVITAASAGPDDAGLLAISVGDPLLVERRVIVDGDGRRIEATESRYPADRYALAVQFDVERTGGGGSGNGNGRGPLAAEERPG